MMRTGGPKLLPLGTVDTHFHLFGPSGTYPYAEGRGYTPDDAGLDTYLAMAASLGIARAVLVQPSPYGTDNCRLLDGLAQSPIPMRGVVAVDAGVTDPDLAMMHDAGVRAIRINLVFDAAAAVATAIRMAPRLRELGWHIQFLVDVSGWPDMATTLRNLGVPVVFDHLGHMAAAKGIEDAGFQTLLALLREGNTWVKASGLYRMSGQGAPHQDMRPFLEAVVLARPDRVLWATDWPHSAVQGPAPDAALLATALQDWLGDDGLRHRVFVQNAFELYGF